MSSYVHRTIVVRRARPENLEAIEGLLTAAGLPLAGVRESLDGFLVAVAAEGVVGAIGLERHGDFGLLRSAVVAENARKRGIGGLLTQRLLEGARAYKVKAVYLLTMDANEYFARFGFRRITRTELPPDVMRSPELSACPQSAVVMALAPLT